MGLMCARFCVKSPKLAKNDVLQKEHKIEILSLACLLNILPLSKVGFLGSEAFLLGVRGF